MVRMPDSPILQRGCGEGKTHIALQQNVGVGSQQEKHDHQQDHQIDVQQQQNRAVIKVPAFLQAPGRVPCSAADYQEGKNQPEAGLHIRETGHAKTDGEAREGQDSATGQGSLFEPEDWRSLQHCIHSTAKE